MESVSMAIEMVSADSESHYSGITIRPITPKNVISLPSSLCKNKKYFRPENQVKSSGYCKENLHLNNLFIREKNDNGLSNSKGFIDQIFEKYDDVHAAFVKCDNENKELTSQPTYSAVLDLTPPPLSPQKFITEEARSSRRQATYEGRKDFCEILEHAGINSSVYLAGVFSSKKKGKIKFGCSTPIQTPCDRISTPMPISGIKLLVSPLTTSKKYIPDSPSTPVSARSYTLDPKNIQVTEDMKTILLGITCYVDVRTEKENRSEICKNELLSIGAKIEKNFTKKVTHVIFKEGRMSTYVRAKKFGIPIVSVVWIEACKIAKGPVDPSLYPPTKMDKYENESPFTLLMKRKLNRLRKVVLSKDKKGESLVVSSNVQKCPGRNAITEFKENREPRKLSNQERNCTKKLNFVDIDDQKDLANGIDLMKIDSVLNESNNLSDSSVFAEFKLKILPKRKSAPGALAKKKKGRLKTLDNYFVNQNNGVKTDKKNSLDDKSELVLSTQKYVDPEQSAEAGNNLMNNIPDTESKKRKLFDPTESNTLKEILPINMEVLYPYPDSPAPTRKKPKLQIDSNERNGQINQQIKTKKYENDNTEQKENNSPTPRSSVSLFVNRGKSIHSKPRSAPTIVLTSLDRRECDQLSIMIRNLGTFEIENQVTERTSHVVTNSLRRTINLFKGLARGCWIVKLDWIIKSEAASKWLAEEHFELRTFSPAVSACRLERQIFKKPIHMDLFSSCGTIYVSTNTIPPAQDLTDLIKLCGGKVVNCARGANIIVGDKKVSDHSIVRVREKWILDSIFYYKLADYNKYLVSKTRNGKTLNENASVNK